MNQEKITELHNLMKEAKIYSLPTLCKCGYIAKKNWIDMEKHYTVCSQYRNLIKLMVSEFISKTERIKSIGIETAEKIEQVVIELRKAENKKNGDGYRLLHSMKSEIPDKLYEALKLCLNNPQKEFIIHLHYQNVKKED